VLQSHFSHCKFNKVESSWNVMAHGDAREKWRENKRMEWMTSTRHMPAEHRLARAVQTLLADVNGSPASSRLNWRPRRFKWTRPFRRKTKSGFCACAITFQTQSTTVWLILALWNENPDIDSLTSMFRVNINSIILSPYPKTNSVQITELLKQKKYAI
jgi:hypothetical protein